MANAQSKSRRVFGYARWVKRRSVRRRVTGARQPGRAVSREAVQMRKNALASV